MRLSPLAKNRDKCLVKPKANIPCTSGASGSSLLLVAIYRGSPGKANHLREGGEGRSERMAEAKGINPHITPEVTEEVKEITAEVAEEVKEATAEVVEKLSAPKGAQLMSLRETVSSEG